MDVKLVRDRAHHYLSDEVAKSCGLTGLSELQRFVSGGFTPSPQQLQALAQRMGVEQR